MRKVKYREWRRRGGGRQSRVLGREAMNVSYVLEVLLCGEHKALVSSISRDILECSLSAGIFMPLTLQILYRLLWGELTIFPYKDGI